MERADPAFFNANKAYIEMLAGIGEYRKVSEFVKKKATHENIGWMLSLFKTENHLQILFEIFDMDIDMEFIAVKSLDEIYNNITLYIPFIKYKRNIYYILCRAIDDVDVELVRMLMSPITRYRYENYNEKELVLNPMMEYIARDGTVATYKNSITAPNNTILDIFTLIISIDDRDMYDIFKLVLDTGRVSFSLTHIENIRLDFIKDYLSIVDIPDIRDTFPFIIYILCDSIKNDYLRNHSVEQAIISIQDTISMLIAKYSLDDDIDRSSTTVSISRYNEYLKSIWTRRLYENGDPTILDLVLNIKNPRLLGIILGYGADIYSNSPIIILYRYFADRDFKKTNENIYHLVEKELKDHKSIPSRFIDDPAFFKCIDVLKIYYTFKRVDIVDKKIDKKTFRSFKNSFIDYYFQNRDNVYNRARINSLSVTEPYRSVKIVPRWEQTCSTLTGTRSLYKRSDNDLVKLLRDTDIYILLYALEHYQKEWKTSISRYSIENKDYRGIAKRDLCAFISYIWKLYKNVYTRIRSNIIVYRYDPDIPFEYIDIKTDIKIEKVSDLLKDEQDNLESLSGQDINDQERIFIVKRGDTYKWMGYSEYYMMRETNRYIDNVTVDPDILEAMEEFFKLEKRALLTSDTYSNFLIPGISVDGNEILDIEVDTLDPYYRQTVNYRFKDKKMSIDKKIDKIFIKLTTDDNDISSMLKYKDRVFFDLADKRLFTQFLKVKKILKIPDGNEIDIFSRDIKSVLKRILTLLRQDEISGDAYFIEHIGLMFAIANILRRRAEMKIEIDRLLVLSPEDLETRRPEMEALGQEADTLDEDQHAYIQYFHNY